ncbi:MAG: 50S ribosomal protein L4, partial [Clostridia bacterium]
AVLHEVLTAELAAARQGTAATKTRAMVKGGGRKPFKQKGTGRARQGSIRGPQWTGGGVVFAPKPRDFSQKINKKMKIVATLSVLSTKVANSEITVIDQISLEAAKTKFIAAMLNAFEATGKVLLVMDSNDETILRACANIPNLTVINADLVNVYDLVANAKCFATEAAIRKIEEVYA